MIKLSLYNIAWDAAKDGWIYEEMRALGYKGLEIAPTRIFLENPYDHLIEAGSWARFLSEKNHLIISSMQSIWHGRSERLFGFYSIFDQLLEPVFKETINIQNERERYKYAF